MNNTLKSRTKKDTALRSFPVSEHFKILLSTVITNSHYKNITEFVLECIKFGENEIAIELGELKKTDQLSIDSSGKLNRNTNELLTDFLKTYSVEDILNEADTNKSISWNMDKTDFMNLKSIIPLSSYPDLRSFYITQVYNGLRRMIKE